MIKEGLIPGIQTLKSCLEMLTFSMQNVKVNNTILEDKKYDYLFTVEEVNKLVQQGIAFRDAYRIVGEQVQEGKFKSDKDLDHTHSGSIGNLCLDEINNKMNKAL